jgi:hypothetical protein
MSGKDDLSRPEKFQISNTQHPFSRTPTSKAQSFCNKDQVGGRQGSNRKPFKPQTFQTSNFSNSSNPERLYLLVALPLLRHNHSAIKTKWEGDRAVTANPSNFKLF